MVKEGRKGKEITLEERVKWRWLRKGERERKRLGGEQILLRNNVCMEANVNVIRLNLTALRTV